MKREIIKDINVLSDLFGCFVYEVVRITIPEEDDAEEINKIILTGAEVTEDGELWYKGRSEEGFKTCGLVSNLCSTLVQAQERLEYLKDNNENT